MKRLLTHVFCIGLLVPSLLLGQSAEVSPKKPWGEFEVVEEEEPTWITHALLWIPNRVLDFFDIFRVDAGAGLATGGVIRVTSWGQLGYRNQSPGMLRVGTFGRDWPVFVETNNEIGAGVAFSETPDRNLCKGVVGAGVDLVLVGGHVGVCPEEIADFFLGLFLIDIMDDDYR